MNKKMNYGGAVKKMMGGSMTDKTIMMKDGGKMPMLKNTAEMRYKPWVAAEGVGKPENKGSLKYATRKVGKSTVLLAKRQNQRTHVLKWQ
jgi:hypothetical protein